VRARINPARVNELLKEWGFEVGMIDYFKILHDEVE